MCANGQALLDKRLVWQAPMRRAAMSGSNATGGAAHMLSPKAHRMSMLTLLKPGKKSGAAPDRDLNVWSLVDNEALKYELLALELKLNLPKTLCVGVILVQPGQDEAAAMSNSMSKELEAFLACISAPVETRGWSGYLGGMPNNAAGTIYYTSWKSFEIVFHVAPLLSVAQVRQSEVQTCLCW